MKNTLLSTIISAGITACGGETITNNYFGTNENQSGGSQMIYTCETGTDAVIDICCYKGMRECGTEKEISETKDFLIKDCNMVSETEYPDPLEYFRCAISFCEGTNQQYYPEILDGEDCGDLYLD